MRLSVRKGCAGAALLGIVGLGLLVGWAITGTVQVDGPPPPPAPPPLATEVGSFQLEISPQEAPIDQAIEVRLVGLEPGEAVVLRASTEDALGVEFSSWARFVAGAAGTLDLGEAAPLAGTYEGADSSGLLWSMSAGDESHFVTSESWGERQVRLSAETANGVAEVTLTRRYPWAVTERESISTSGLVAELTVPATEGPLPVVLLLAGWGDGPAPLSSALLASHGYAVLNLGFHHWEGTPELLVEIPVESVTRALDWIERDPRLDGERIGIYGTSKGAELALLAAAHDPRLKAVAAWVPSSSVFAGIDFRNPDPGSSWTLAGKPLPYAVAAPGRAEVRNSLRFLLRRPMIFAPSYRKALAAAPAEAVIPVEEIAAPLLLVSGTDDQVWPSSLMADQIERRRREHLSNPRVDNLVFDRAGHGINYNLWPSGGRRTGLFYRGGTASVDHRAGQVAWAAMLEFFDQQLVETRPF